MRDVMSRNMTWLLCLVALLFGTEVLAATPDARRIGGEVSLVDECHLRLAVGPVGGVGVLHGGGNSLSVVGFHVTAPPAPGVGESQSHGPGHCSECP